MRAVILMLERGGLWQNVRCCCMLCFYLLYLLLTHPFHRIDPLLPFQLPSFFSLSLFLIFITSHLRKGFLPCRPPPPNPPFNLLWPDNPSPQRPRPPKPRPRLHPRSRSLEPRLILLAPNRAIRPANGRNLARRPTTRTPVQRPLPIWQTPCLRIPIYLGSTIIN